MKLIKFSLFTTFFTLALMQTGVVAAYKLGTAQIRYYVYESGGTLNRLFFEVLDDSDNYVNNKSVVTDVVLKNPGGSPVNLATIDIDPPTTIGFDPLYDFFGAYYDKENSVWNYAPQEQFSDFYANITDTLEVGQYTLEVSVIGGQTLTKSINFEFLLKLPIISSRTFQIQSDSDGNVYWTWDIPEQIINLTQTYNLQIRAGVAAKVAGQIDALYWPNIPIEMGFCFIPHSIYQNLASRADEILFAFQVRTSNNNARAYSDKISVIDLSSPISITPKKSVVVVPLN